MVLLLVFMQLTRDLFAIAKFLLLFYSLLWSIKRHICKFSPQKLWGFLSQCTVYNKLKTFTPVLADIFYTLIWQMTPLAES